MMPKIQSLLRSGILCYADIRYELCYDMNHTRLLFYVDFQFKSIYCVKGQVCCCILYLHILKQTYNVLLIN